MFSLDVSCIMSRRRSMVYVLPHPGCSASGAQLCSGTQRGPFRAEVPEVHHPQLCLLEQPMSCGPALHCLPHLLHAGPALLLTSCQQRQQRSLHEWNAGCAFHMQHSPFWYIMGLATALESPTLCDTPHLVYWLYEPGSSTKASIPHAHDL